MQTDASVPIPAPPDTVRKEKQQVTTARSGSEANAPRTELRPQVPVFPACSVVRRLTREVAGAAAQGQPRARARVKGGGTARQQVGASSRARARTLFLTFPSARLPPSRRVPLSLSAAHSLELLPGPSPRPRLSSPAAQPWPLGALSQISSRFTTTLPFPPF
ncbi:Hypothetical predicted protein [Marmota monax]|uniref:Uncharacterized protein n=1 Tax=Marmota monax TaxID=9995 RepID=A0A5E4B9H9_MARMO|nr:Hypothetical predicted protein [Marmota monax]